jgi:sigma-B regulation protein RsbU (phosphoserine phosphatase)
MFVTVFYGILDLATGILTYCNAGHDPPYLISARKDGTFQELRRTGIALGVYENLNWKRESAQITKGDTLLLYTDGVTEAHDIQGLLFGKERCLKALQANQGGSAQEIQDTLIKEIQQFVRSAPQFDDIALMVIVRGLSS